MASALVLTYGGATLFRYVTDHPAIYPVPPVVPPPVPKVTPTPAGPRCGPTSCPRHR